MEITVKYFGIIADITQKKEEVFLIDNDFLSAKELESKIKINYPKILDIKYLIAINKSIISNCDSVLYNKDEVALLPPFAGG